MDYKEHQKQMAKILQDPAMRDNLKMVTDAAFGGQKKMEPMKEPTHAVVIDTHGDIGFSVRIGRDWFPDYASANYFCQQHIMDAANQGIKGASRWKVRPAFVSV